MKKPKLTLADAVSKGREFGPLRVGREPMIITRALQAIEMLPSNLDKYDRYSPEQRKTLGYEADTLVRLYPWLKQKQVCPWCAETIDRSNVVLHPFAHHVCHDEAKLEDHCAWLQDGEEELDPLISVAIYFNSDIERLRVLWEAQRQNLTLNAFLAASVRMVLEHHLVLTEFACPDPMSMKEQN